jgi:hypothetical protein
MAEQKVFIVILRQPRADDPRSDPFYEFGSFGCTGCHHDNLFSPSHAADVEGAHLAFAQGGEGCFRLVYITPPVTMKKWLQELPDRCEAQWPTTRKPDKMPFVFAKAPLLIDNDGTSDFGLLKQFVLQAAASTVQGKSLSLCQRFASRFRSRTRPLPKAIANQVILVYEDCRKDSLPSAIASAYHEALPYTTRIDYARQDTYESLIESLGGHLVRVSKAKAPTRPGGGVPRRRPLKPGAGKRSC